MDVRLEDKIKKYIQFQGLWLYPENPTEEHLDRLRQSLYPRFSSEKLLPLKWQDKYAVAEVSFQPPYLRMREVVPAFQQSEKELVSVLAANNATLIAEVDEGTIIQDKDFIISSRFPILFSKSAGANTFYRRPTKAGIAAIISDAKPCELTIKWNYSDRMLKVAVLCQEKALLAYGVVEKSMLSSVLRRPKKDGSNWYFHYKREEKCFVITPRRLWHLYHTIPDQHLAKVVQMPDGFAEVCDGSFKYQGRMQEGKRLLSESGFSELTRPYWWSSALTVVCIGRERYDIQCDTPEIKSIVRRVQRENVSSQEYVQSLRRTCRQHKLSLIRTEENPGRISVLSTELYKSLPKMPRGLG